MQVVIYYYSHSTKTAQTAHRVDMSWARNAADLINSYFVRDWIWLGTRYAETHLGTDSVEPLWCLGYCGY